ncbi:IclR family transcriptional regulator [Sporosarcina obsidiansis]|uniref:IclR family transcriptional regulator n=1 Tax=Sporosarcina obsidiansis TaxID=2660748 RepID=UPI00129A63BE|nr:IclR family transcriptional regulator [Sporosarcina obsidiansis]
MNQTQTVGRALDILFTLAEENKSMTVKEISEKVSIPTSTVYRLIKTLELNEVVTREPHGEIGLGIKLFSLAQNLYLKVENDLLGISLPLLKDLTEKLNETSFLAIKKGDVGVTVQSVEVDRLIRFVAQKGKQHSLTEGATGKAILAFEKKNIIDDMLSIHPSIDQVRFFEEVKKICQQGYVKTIGEVDADTLAIAAPIFDLNNNVIASITVAGPKVRFDEDAIDRTIQEIKKATSELTTALRKL